MIVVNTETVPGHDIVALKGLVQGSTIRAKHLGRDIGAGLKNLVSSGLSVTDQTDEVSTVVVARAESCLAKEAPKRLIPFRRHWTGKYLYIPFRSWCN